MDDINRILLAKLRGNARLSWQRLGRQVKLTGQAVAARVAQMEDDGVISGYTIRQDGLSRHFLTIFMNDGRFDAFEAFIRADDRVEAAHKVSGEGCYHLTLASNDPQALPNFIDEIGQFARVRVLSATRKVK